MFRFIRFFHLANFGKCTIISAGQHPLNRDNQPCQMLFKLLLVFVFSLVATSTQATPPKVVTTIKPIHSIVSNISEGVFEPILLLPDGSSPHTFQLKPSQRYTLLQANLIFWLGPTAENYLAKILGQYSDKSIQLMAAPNLQLLKFRTTRSFTLSPGDSKPHSDAHDHHHDHHHHHGHEHGDHDHHNHDLNTFDSHIWLSIDNAMQLTRYITLQLITMDPTHQHSYQTNSEQYLKRLAALKQKLKTELADPKIPPFLVFHDAYQYFEADYHLQSIGTILLNPHVPLTPKAIHELRQLAKDHHVQCIYYEPEFNKSMLKPKMDLPGIEIRELDPLGARQPKGKACYENLMLALAQQFLTCQPH